MTAELITIRQIEERYGIASTTLKTIRSPRNNFNFPAPIENENPRDLVKKYRLDQVDDFFRKNNVEKVSAYSNKGNGSTMDNLLAFYKRNFPDKQHGGGKTVSVIIRPSDDEHWDNDHHRGGFIRSGGVTCMYGDGF